MANNIEVIQAIIAIDSNANVGASGDPYDADAITLTWTSSEISLADIKTKMAELQTAYDNLEYARNRAKEYPSMKDQLDDIYHNGIDAWKATIKVTKDKYPKG